MDESESEIRKGSWVPADGRRCVMRQHPRLIEEVIIKDQLVIEKWEINQADANYENAKNPGILEAVSLFYMHRRKEV